MAVARSASTASSVFSASKVAEGRIIAAPVTAAAIVPMTQPKQWYSGTGMQMRSCSVAFRRCAMKRPLLIRFECVSSTPLGEPVVPDVYWMLATSPAAG